MEGQSFKSVLKLFILGMSWACIYLLGFIQYLLYDPFKEALGCTNAQLGFLMTIFGLGNIFGAPIGGWLADRFDYRKIYTFSLVGNGVLSLIFAFNMTYSMAVIVWIGLAITTLVMHYPSHIKIVGLLADDKNQGKIFGFNEAFIGIGNIIANAILLYLFARGAEAIGGIKLVIYGIAVLSFIIAAAVWWILHDVKGGAAETKSNAPAEKIAGKDFFIVLTSPTTWIVGIGIFSVYSFAVTMSYFTPYLTAVLGGTVAISGVISIIRTHGTRLIGAPLGGFLSDRMGSVSKVLIIIYLCGIAMLLLFLKLPTTVSISIFVFMTLIVACLVYMGKGIYYAVPAELAIPKKYAATTVGIAAALGFSPDIFLFALAGHWLDNYGNDGYTYLFIYQIIVLAIGIAGSLLALHYRKKMLQKQSQSQSSAQ